MPNPTAEEIRILQLVNDQRPSTITQLTSSTSLYRAARQHSRNMRRRRSLTHQTSQQLQRLARRIRYAIIAENIGSGFGASQSQSTQLVASWMASPLHRQNIVNRVFEEAAVAVAGSGNNRYFTLLLGGRGPELRVRWVQHRQQGSRWTHKGEILVRDNRDISQALRVYVQLLSGTGITILSSTGFTSQPARMPLRPLRTVQRRNRFYGVENFYAVQQGTNRFTLRIYALDARDNRSANVDLVSN